MSDLLKFAPETSADTAHLPPWPVLVVDDDPQVHVVTRLALQDFSYERRPLRLLHAHSGEEARQLMRDNPSVAAILLDVVMENDHAGLDVVDYVRNTLKNHLVRIILRTGQPGLAPEDTVIRGYEINDYRHKTELTRQRLATALYAALATYSELQRMDSDASFKNLREEALRLARTRTDLLNNVSHELRTPMNGVVGMTDMLLMDTALTPDQRDAAETIRFSAEALMKIFNDILDLKTAEAGATQLGIDEVDVRALLDEIGGSVTELAARKRIRVIWSIAEQVPPRLLGDAAHLRQVLGILVANAVKFTERGEICLFAGLNHATPADAAVRFVVRDTGIGIAPEIQRKLFMPFVQADSSSTRKHGGLGLGLSICRHLVNLMGGEIELASEPGKGSRFQFGLTMKRPPASAATPHHLADMRTVECTPAACRRIQPQVCSELAPTCSDWRGTCPLVGEGPPAGDAAAHRASAASPAQARKTP